MHKINTISWNLLYYIHNWSKPVLTCNKKDIILVHSWRDILEKIIDCVIFSPSQFPMSKSDISHPLPHQINHMTISYIYCIYFEQIICKKCLYWLWNYIHLLYNCISLKAGIKSLYGLCQLNSNLSYKQGTMCSLSGKHGYIDPFITWVCRCTQ